jgi:formylglycine-generating enzyme required for sulfatase activity
VLVEAYAERVLSAFGPEGDANEALVLADYFLERDELRLAASALDRAFGLRPDDPHLARQREGILDRLAVTEHGLRFRYVPAGTFLMGSDDGEPDEWPVHPVRLDGFWITEIPLTWSAHCQLMGFHPPPSGFPPGEWDDWNEEERATWLGARICLQYCETSTREARDWHAHHPDTDEEFFGRPEREDPSRPYQYDVKPVVAVSWGAADTLSRRLSTDELVYGLPTEPQWEKAARGGLVGARYSWGDRPADRTLCDCDRFGEFSIRPQQAFPRNGYGLQGVCGGVWEWTAAHYDALAYLPEPERPPVDDDAELLRVVRGGSWADAPEACTVSFRHSRAQDDSTSPNVGYRLCRLER